MQAEFARSRRAKSAARVSATMYLATNSVAAQVLMSAELRILRSRRVTVGCGMIALLLAATAVGAATTQARVDQLVQQCAAEKVVRLTAHGGAEVLISMKIVNRAPSLSENKKFECVLRGMRQMRGLQFGFMGNEAFDR